MMEDARAYEELRVGFTAAVSHELRTPLARLLALLDSADLPGADRDALLAEAREQVEEMKELIDDVLFLSELESGRQVVALGGTLALPVLEETRDRLADSAARADVSIRVDARTDVEIPLRRRMLQVVGREPRAELRSATPGLGATLLLAARPGELEVSDDGRGVEEGRAPAALRAVLPQRSRARVARHRAWVSRSSSTSWPPLGVGCRRRGGPGRGLRIVCSFPAP
jgi:signal transduction histidine kinase